MSEDPPIGRALPRPKHVHRGWLHALDRKLLRDLRGHRGLLFAIVSIMTIGVAAYVELSSIHRNLSNAKRVYYAQCRMADFSLELKKVPVSQLGVLSRFPEILEIRPRIRFFALVDLDRVPEVLNGQVLSLPDRRQDIINDIVLQRGSYFTNTRDNEVIVNEAFAKRHALRPGQYIHLLLNNRRQELFIVGTCISSEFVYLVGPGSIAPDPEHFGVFYLKQTYAEDVFDFAGAANEVLGRIDPELREHPDDLLRRAENVLAAYGVMSSTSQKNQPSNRFVSEEIKGLSTFATVLPAIFLAVSALVLNVLMIRFTEQQRTVIGTLKAIGYSSRQVFSHYLKFALAIGGVAGLTGCGLGYFLAYLVTKMYGQFYEFPDLHNRFYADKMLQGLGISLGCAAVGAWQGARQVLHLNPASAMRAKPPESGKAVLLEHIAWLWRQLGFGWRMVLRNLSRHRLRTLAGMFAAAMGAAILVTGLMLQSAMLHLIDFTFSRVQRSDVDLAFKDERGREALLEARDLPGVDKAEPVLDVVCTFINGPYRRRGAVTGLASNASLTIPRDTAGNALRIPSAGLLMSRKLAEVLHVQRGDTIVVRPIKGLREERQALVVAITDGYLGTAVYADFDYVNRLVHEEQTLSGVQLATDQYPEHQAELHRQLKQLPGLSSVNQRADAVENLVETIIKTQRIIIGILIMFAGVIFFGSILNSSLISLAEREREVATFRVLGYTEWQIGGLFLRESLVINTLGTLLGLPLGYKLTELMAWSYETELFRIPVISRPYIWWTTLLLSLVFGLIAHLCVQRAINRLNWREALNVKE
ncbi:MAG: ABC transporter permease [Pirellulales bacterium]